MHHQRAGVANQADDLLELISVREELLARAAERSVESIPRERHVLDERVLPELELEQTLPPWSVRRPGRVVEQQQVSPPVRRVAGGANHEVAVARFDDVVDREDVVVGRPYQGFRHCLCAHGPHSYTHSRPLW